MLRRRGWRAVPVAVALVGTLVLAGCSGDDSSAEPAQPTVRRATTTSAAPTTTATPATTAVPGQEDWYAILSALLAERDRAYETNDVTILERIYTPDCECLAKAKEVIAQRQAEGVHVQGERLKLLKASLVNMDGADRAYVRGLVEQGPNQLVNARGEVVRAGETEPPTSYVYGLSRSPEGWRVGEIIFEHEGE